jgi:hypothetical protein
MARIIKESGEVRVVYLEDKRVLWVETWDNRHRFSKRALPDVWFAKTVLNAGLIDWSDWTRGRGPKFEKSK